jgi:transcriptional regulator with XRE-family HTH domain
MDDEKIRPGVIMTLDALIKAKGIDVNQIANKSGIPPPQLLWILSGTSWKILATWERALRSLGAELFIVSKMNIWEVPLSALRQEDLDRARQDLERLYSSASGKSGSANIDGPMGVARQAMATPYASGKRFVSNLAEIVQNLAAQRGLLEMHLPLISGIARTASRRFMNGEEWPALGCVRCVFASLDCRMEARAGKMIIRVAGKEPRVRRKGKKAKSKSQKKVIGGSKLTQNADQKSTLNRAVVSTEEIVALLRQGHTQAYVADIAGISRQRVHVIANGEGLGGVRSRKRIEAAKEGLDTLRKLSSYVE